MKRSEIAFLCKKYHLEPRREQGQHFLLDAQVVRDAIEAAEVTRDDTVCEIGPGFGMLTTQLAERAKRVVAIEQDRHLFSAVQLLAKQYSAITPVLGDVRTVHLAELGLVDHEYLLVANLPYSITSWVLRTFLEQPPRPKRLVVMVQQEVAQRVVAAPGEMSILSVAVQCLTTVRIVRTVSRRSFEPMPEVDSALLALVPHPSLPTSDPQSFMRLVRIGFAAKRKQLQNNLQAGFSLRPSEARALLEDIGLPATVRPQELAVADWEALRKALHGNGQTHSEQVGALAIRYKSDGRE